MSNIRPIYETTGTLIAEEEAVARAAAAWQFDYRKLAMKNEIDFALLREDRVCAWVECKRRYNDIGRYPTFMLSFHKWQAGRRHAIFSGVPFLLLVQWNDGLYWANTDKVRLSHVGLGGRTDRNDTQDIEPSVFIDIDQFQRLE